MTTLSKLKQAYLIFEMYNDYQNKCRVYDDELQANIDGYYTFTSGGLLLHKMGNFNDFIKQ